jgi:hypothetical protein
MTIYENKFRARCVEIISRAAGDDERREHIWRNF